MYEASGMVLALVALRLGGYAPTSFTTITKLKRTTSRESTQCFLLDSNLCNQ